MARKSGVLIRQLFGNCSNPCAGLLLHRRKLYSNSIQTLTLSSLWTFDLELPSYFLCKLPLFSPNLHFVQRSNSGLLFSSPAKMVIISNTDDYYRAIKDVEDGLLPAVFYFVSHRCTPVSTAASTMLLNLRKKYPHVTIYKTIKTPVVDMENILVNMETDHWPTFHCYQNGKLVAEIMGPQLRDAFEQLYTYVVPIETTRPTSSFGMGERRAQQLVVQAKKEENDKGVGWKVGTVGALLQCRGAATLSERRDGLVEAVESSTAPSLDDVMQAVESLPGGRSRSPLWWFARGLFKYQPKKRVMFSNVNGPYFKVTWLLHEMAEE